jgi:hypothetical protein
MGGFFSISSPEWAVFRGWAYFFQLSFLEKHCCSKMLLTPIFHLFLPYKGLRGTVFRGWAVFFSIPSPEWAVSREWAELEGGRFLEEIRYLL